MLNADELLEALTEGTKSIHDTLVVSPLPNLDRLKSQGSASLDLRLGSWLATPRHGKRAAMELGPELTRPSVAKSRFVPLGDRYYLHPGDFALAVTLEWIRLPSTLGGYVIGKSSWGRRGLVIATATGVHPGYSGCLTLELANMGELPIEIMPGMRICQIFLHQTKGGARAASSFGGHRKPVLGSLEPDDLVEALRRLNKEPQTGDFGTTT